MAIKEETVSSRLVFAFKAKNLKEVAVKIEEEYTSLHNWTSGRRDFPTEVLLKIAKMTNVSIDYLLTGENVNMPELSMDILLEEKIRRIVREELAGQEFYEVDLPAKNIKKEKKKAISSPVK